MPYLIWYLCSVTSDDDCALSSPLQFCAVIGFLCFNPCVGGEGFPWSDAIVPLKSRADRRVLGFELLTLHSLAAMLKGVLRFKESTSCHCPFPPGMLPTSSSLPLKWIKNSKSWRREQTGQDIKRMATSKNQSRDGKTFAAVSGTIKGIWKTFMESRNYSKILSVLPLCVRERTVIAAEEVIL